MVITENELRKIIREAIIETLNKDELNEGKLGKALGAAALGAGLMFGNPQPANAQLNVKSVVQNGPKVLVNCPLDNKRIEQFEGYYYLVGASTNRFDDAIRLTLGNSVDSCLQTLNDLNNLVANKTAAVEVDDESGQLIISFDKVGPGEIGLWFSQEGRAGKTFLHKASIDKMIKRLQEIEPSTYHL